MTRFGTDTVLVTGGRRGLGFAFARAFATEGAVVRITTRHVHEGRGAAAAIADGTGAEVDVLCWEMNDPSSTAALEGVIRANPPTILVHAAHDFPAHVPVVGLRPSELAAAVSAYLEPSYTILRAAARQMLRERRGRIVLLSSLAVELGPPGQAAYVASKAALDAIAHVLANELDARGVDILLVRPGIVDTENVRERVGDEARAAYSRASGLGRLLFPEEVAREALEALTQPFATNPRVLRIGALESALR